MFDTHRLAITAILIMSYSLPSWAAEPVTSSTGSPSPAKEASTGQVACVKTDTHPVCVASYTANASATLGNSGTSSGKAIVNGVEVNFVCRAGNADARIPRQCRW